MTKNKSYIIALAATYCALLSIFTLLSLGVALIPHKSIEANCQSSIAVAMLKTDQENQIKYCKFR